MLIVVLGATAILTMPIDIFPFIDIPVLSVVFSYGGLPADEMASRVVTVYERSVTSNVNDIEHIESQSYNGVSIIKIYLHPGAKIEAAEAQVVAGGQSVLRAMPPGIFPPNLIKYDASSVPILQLGLGSKTLSEQELNDLGSNFIRTSLATIQGTTVPSPYGGKGRNIMVDLDPQAMFAKGISATDVSNALNLQALVLPAGIAKFGNREYAIKLNSSPRTVAELNNLPVKFVNGAPIFVRDVAQIRDGATVQNSMVRVNGTRGALMTIMRNGQASTLAIVDQVKKAMPAILAGLPPELEVRQMADQSLFVRAAVNGVLREAGIAAALTGLMILLFLGSWRSTIIVCISIPLSILASLIVLNLMGETINVMTLGGMALAVGILVDDATVAVENTHRNMAMRKPLVVAVLDAAHQIAAPAFVSTLCICVVFVPVLLLTGAARFLFTPLALAVVFAMLASYVLSRTLVPNMIHYMLGAEMKLYLMGEHGETAGGTGIFWTVHNAFNRQFERMRAFYASLLDWALDHRTAVLAAFFLFVIGSGGLATLIGKDFFPTVDSGQLRLHARAPAGTRIEETEVIFARIDDTVRKVIPPDEIDTIIDNIGVPQGGSNLAYGDVPTIGPGDGEVLISLKPERKISTAEYTRLLRRRLNESFPDVTFFFEAANITNQILNFGLPAPIDVQVVGRNADRNFAIAQRLQWQISRIPGAADVHVHQVMNYPEIKLNVDRNKAGMAGLTQRDVANSLMISLSGSGQTAPNQWLNWANGVQYGVSVQTPQRMIDSMQTLLATPIASLNTQTAPASAQAATGLSPNQTTLAYANPGAVSQTTQELSNLISSADRGFGPQIINHYNVQPVFDVYANVDGSDLGSVGDEVGKVIEEARKSLPRGTTLELRGQVSTMQSSFTRLGIGLGFAIMLVYFLMALNFQSWLDPFIILMALPGALAGILWMLFVTQTTFSVPSLMGSIMCIGVATANSILLVVFANDQRLEGMDCRAAALSAGYTRIRPVLMTAAAMIMGMLPMALGMGEGGEQNAPLGRAVIGGLLFATGTTLFIVPLVYSALRKNAPVDYDMKLRIEESEDINRYLSV